MDLEVIYLCRAAGVHKVKLTLIAHALGLPALVNNFSPAGLLAAMRYMNNFG